MALTLLYPGSTGIAVNVEVQSANVEYVYICTGNKSKRYHKSSSCKGLNNCQGEIKKITSSKARAMRRTPCKICYR